MTRMCEELERINRLAVQELQRQVQCGGHGFVEVIITEGELIAGIEFKEMPRDPASVPMAAALTPVSVIRSFPLFSKSNAPSSGSSSGASSSQLHLVSSQLQRDVSPVVCDTPIDQASPVGDAVQRELKKQRADFEHMMSIMDSLRAGSAGAPHQAAWMKLLVHASEPPAEMIVHPMATLAASDVACTGSARTFRPFPLQLFLMQINRLHFDLVKNPLLSTLMRQHGHNGVFCPSCSGKTEYVGDSMTVEAAKKTPTKLGGIRMLLWPSGLFGPCTFGVSSCISPSCSRHGKSFDHIDLLPQLPPSVKLCVPIDPDGSSASATLIHRDVLRPACMDMHLGEGPDNVAEKLTKMGARLVTETINATLDLGQLWLNDLSLLVGDRVWCTLDEPSRLRLAPLRAEWLLAEEQPDKLGLCSPSDKSFTQDPAGFFALPTQPELVRSAVLNVYEARKEHRRAEAAAVGASIKLSFDFTKQSGLNVGEQWLLSVKNEAGQTVGKRAGRTSDYADYEEYIREIGQRENVTAVLLCIDDLMETDMGTYDSRARKLLEWIPSAVECILDRFHVVHRVNEVFNNHHLQYYDLMVVKQRDVVCSRDQQLELKIDARLHEGSLHKTCTFRGTQYVWGGTPMSLTEIAAHKASGLYHAMLSSTGALVPVVPNPRKHVEQNYPIWQAQVSEAIRSCRTATAIVLALAAPGSSTLLVAAGSHVHSWPDACVAPPTPHSVQVPLHTLPYSNGIATLTIISGTTISLNLQLCIGLLEGDDPTSLNGTTLVVTSTVSCKRCIDQVSGLLTVNVACGSVSTSASVDVPLKVSDVLDTKNQLLCNWDDFYKRTTNGYARFQLCSLQKLTNLKPYRATVQDKNQEMQHESLIATASNEHTHRRLDGFSGRGRGAELAVGSMIEGDFIDSRQAAIRHDLPACGADVTHDDLQTAAFANQLAGFDGTGTASSDLPQLLPDRPYNYNLPRAASPSFVVVKRLPGGNCFNHRKPAPSSMASADHGVLALPRLSRRSALALPEQSALMSSSPSPACAQLMRSAHTSAVQAADGRSATRKRKAAAWMPAEGCDCGDKATHEKHVRKCMKWCCSCKPPKKGRGGDATHDPLCKRGMYARHTLPYAPPARGMRVAVIGEARRCGMHDLLFDGHSWVPDPDGRAVAHTAWVLNADQ